MAEVAPAEQPPAAVEVADGAAPGPAPAKGGLTASMLSKAVKQIEFYFSDSNLPRDKFLLEKVHASADGWVDLGLIATFERMRQILKARPRAACCFSVQLLSETAVPRRGCRGNHQRLAADLSALFSTDGGHALVNR
jgi:La domain